MQIRQATAQDVESIAALWHAGWHQAHAKIVPEVLVASRVMDEFLDRVVAHLAQTRVAHKDDRLAGFFMLSGDELYQFYVDAAFQGQGLAAHLMSAAETALAGKAAWLACSVGNDRAAGFYKKAGWVRKGSEIYAVETASGPFEATIWRYEKDLT